MFLQKKAGPLYCSDSQFICENGGTCSNITVDSDSFFGFKCICPVGYSGDLCQTSNFII